MSYNISTIRIVYQSGFGIRRQALRELRLRCPSGNLPENHIFDQLLRDNDIFAEPDEVLKPRNDSFWWSGEWSSHAFDLLAKEVLPAFDGEADLVLTWAKGDSFTGLMLRDHKVTRHKIKMVLGEVDE